MNIDLKSKNLIELKAYAFDVTTLINDYNKVLQVILQELNIRKAESKEKGEAKVRNGEITEIKYEEIP